MVNGIEIVNCEVEPRVSDRYPGDPLPTPGHVCAAGKGIFFCDVVK